MMHQPIEQPSHLISTLYDRPRWFILRTTRQQWVRSWLERHGIEAWYPVETRWRKVPGQRKSVPVERPIVAGYVFANFPGKPLWHEIKHRAAGKVIGVVSNGVTPREFTDAELMQMRSVPDRLSEARTAAEEAKRIRAGDKALHPALGAVRVSGVDGRLAKFIAPMFGGEREVVANVVDLEKIT